MSQDPWLPKDAWKSVKAMKAAFGTPHLPATCTEVARVQQVWSQVMATVMEIKCICAFKHLFSHELVLNSIQLKPKQYFFAHFLAWNATIHTNLFSFRRLAYNVIVVTLLVMRKAWEELSCCHHNKATKSLAAVDFWKSFTCRFLFFANRLVCFFCSP